MAYARPTLLGRFLDWWWPSILAWLPEHVVRVIDLRKPPRFLRWDGGVLIDDAQATTGESTETVAVLPRKLALMRRLRLPAADNRHLRRTAHAQIERLTPFHPDDVHFAVVPHPHSGGKDDAFLNADLVVVPRHTITTVLDVARNSARRLSAIDIAGADQAPLGLDLLPDFARDHTGEHWRRWNFVLAIVCLLAIAGIMIGLLNARERAVSGLEARFQPLRAQAADTLRRERMLRQFESVLRTTSRSTRPTTLEVLSELSARMPMDSHLTYFHLDGGNIAIRGETANLAGMLERLGQSSRWASPNLTGSRTLADGHSQAFSMTLALKRTPPKGLR